MAGFIQDHCDRARDHCNGILESGRETGLNPKYNMGKWEYIFRNRVEVSGWEITKRNIRDEGSGKFWLNQSNIVDDGGR